MPSHITWSDCDLSHWDCSPSKDNSWSFRVAVVSLKACVDRKIYPSPLHLGSHWIYLAKGPYVDTCGYMWIPIWSYFFKDEHPFASYFGVHQSMIGFWPLLIWVCRIWKTPVVQSFIYGQLRGYTISGRIHFRWWGVWDIATGRSDNVTKSVQKNEKITHLSTVYFEKQPRTTKI